MNQDSQSLSSSKAAAPIKIDLDEFQITEETFKPMTKGLGFHHDQKKPSFKPAPKEVKPFGSSARMDVSSTLSPLKTTTHTTQVNANSLPSGLEAFYGTAQASKMGTATDLFVGKNQEISISKNTIVELRTASMFMQFGAWITDILVVASFVVLTAVLLVMASGIDYKLFTRILSPKDIATFSLAIFSIYYLLYFTILDLSATPGKTIFGIKLTKTNGSQVRVKHTFLRAMISLISGVALFLPLLLDFQGRLSDTKVVKH